MARWTPKLASNLDWSTLQLTAEEGFLLSRVDGRTHSDDLAHVAGLPKDQFETALARLRAAGVLEDDAVDAPTEVMEPLGPPVLDEPTQMDEPPASEAAAAPAQTGAEPQAAKPAAAAPAASAPEEEEDDGKDAPEDPVVEATYRKLFETKLHALSKDERAALAVTATLPELLALCFDPDPMVINAVLDRTETGLEHARLIATHHRNPVGLDALARRSGFLRDGTVQRMLLRNPQLSDGAFKLVAGNKPLSMVYKFTIDRNLPERTITRARTLFRTRFSTANGEERANLIFATEGRMLAAVSGIPLDSRCIQLLCARSWASLILIQNMLRFAGAPPPLLIHIARQPIVKRQPQLKTLLLQHPNAPAEVKRMLSGG